MNYHEELKKYRLYAGFTPKGVISAYNPDALRVINKGFEVFKSYFNKKEGVIIESDNLVKISTGGYSHNEDLMEAFKPCAWFVQYWQYAARGGHYYFDTDGDKQWTEPKSQEHTALDMFFQDRIDKAIDEKMSVGEGKMLPRKHYPSTIKTRVSLPVTQGEREALYWYCLLSDRADVDAVIEFARYLKVPCDTSGYNIDDSGLYRVVQDPKSYTGIRIISGTVDTMRARSMPIGWLMALLVRQNSMQLSPFAPGTPFAVPVVNGFDDFFYFQSYSEEVVVKVLKLIEGRPEVTGDRVFEITSAHTEVGLMHRVADVNYDAFVEELDPEPTELRLLCGELSYGQIQTLLAQSYEGLHIRDCSIPASSDTEITDNGPMSRFIDTSMKAKHVDFKQYDIPMMKLGARGETQTNSSRYIKKELLNTVRRLQNIVYRLAEENTGNGLQTVKELAAFVSEELTSPVIYSEEAAQHMANLAAARLGRAVGVYKVQEGLHILVSNIGESLEIINMDAKSIEQERKLLAGDADALQVVPECYILRTDNGDHVEFSNDADENFTTRLTSLLNGNKP